MNDKLKNLSVNPAPEVWDSISHSLRRRQHLRRVLTGAAVIAVTGVAVAVLLLNKPAEPQSPAIAANTVITESPEISSEKTVISEEIPEQQISVEPEAAVAANRAETAAARPASNLPKIAPAPAMNALQEQMPELYEAQETPAASAVSEAVAAMLEDERTTVVNTVSGSEMTTAAKSTTEETPILWIPNAFAPVLRGHDNGSVSSFSCSLGILIHHGFRHIVLIRRQAQNKRRNVRRAEQINAARLR